MKIWQNEEEFTCNHPVTEELCTESTLFFDIETTGFSPTNTHAYLIGCAARRGGRICATQFFAEKPQEEQDILTAFFKLANRYERLISYNGQGFDIPYLNKRAGHYGLNASLTASHLDIFKQMSGFKPLLKLPNLKQKTLETFLGIGREDKYSGGDLINVYRDYARQPDEEKAALLQLHNYEDLLGMPGLLPILSYPRLFEGRFDVQSCDKNVYKSYDGTQGLELILTLGLSSPLPKRFSFSKQDIYLTACGSQAKLKVPIYQGELKYFYPNYRDYYYLPTEDRAIHKSVAFYVDKNFRTKAKAATCYSKKAGCFLPQYTETSAPCFKLGYSDKNTWFEMDESFTGSLSLQEKYAQRLLEYLKKQT